MRYNKATEKEIISLREAHGIGERLGEQLCETDGRIYSLDQFPVSDELANQITPDFLPASWAKLWNSKSAKHRLWRMIEASIIEKLKNNPPLATVVLDLHNGERVQFGSREPLPLSELRYGEGDLKSIYWAAFLAWYLPTTSWLDGKTPVGAIATNDWDLPVTTVLVNPTWKGSEVDIILGKGYVDSRAISMDSTEYSPQAVALTAASGRKRFGPRAESALEVLPMKQIHSQSFLAAGYSHRLTYVFLLLCCAGVDYCDGLQKFGYTLGSLLKIVGRFKRGEIPPFVSAVFDVEDPLVRVFRLNTAEFLLNLGSPTKRNASAYNVSAAEFTSEIHAIIFTVQYFAGFCCTLPRGGPPIPDFTAPLWMPNGEKCDTLHDLLRFASTFQPFTCIEEYPCESTDDLLLPPEMTYGLSQAKAIRKMSSV